MAKKYTNLGERLRKLLFERRMRPADLAREANIPTTTLHRLITGKSTRPYTSSLKPIADYFAISVDQLVGEKPVNKFFQDETTNLIPSGQIKLVPIIKWNQVINFEIGNYEKNKLTVEIAVSGKINDKAFALIMPDSSMEPLFPYGTILIFNPESRVKDRSYALVKLTDIKIPIFRQILIDLEHKFIKPLNPDLNFGMRLLDNDAKIIANLYESRINHQLVHNEELIKELYYVD